MTECDVKLFALSTCVHCRSTKDFLNECGINYDCVDVDKLDADERKKVLEEIKQLNPNCSFPTIVIGEKIIVGFREDEIKEALNIK
ncbi:MAG: glutaredoxin family protein [Syntrophobacteraceae bacterium]